MDTEYWPYAAVLLLVLASRDSIFGAVLPAQLPPEVPRPGLPPALESELAIEEDCACCERRGTLDAEACGCCCMSRRVYVRTREVK